MATFQITGPNGKKYRVTGETAEGAYGALRKSLRESQPSATIDMQPSEDAMPEYDAMGDATGSSAPVPVTSMPYGEQMGNVGRTIDSGMRLLANGATFNLADKAAGGMDAMTGNAGSYDEGVTAQRARTQELRDAAPGLALATEAAGGLLSGVGLVKNGITLAGRVGSGLLPRIAAFGAEGAGYGAAQGAGNTYSDDWKDYAANAGESGLVGAEFGAALPAFGSLISGAYRTARPMLEPAIEGIGHGASTLLRGAAQADEAGLRALPAMGPEAMMVDAGPSMLGLGQGAATGIGPGRSALVGALRTRDDGTGPRLAAALDTHLGPAPIPSLVDASIRASQRTLSPAYEQAFADARRVETEPIANVLESAIVNGRGSAQAAAREVRSMLNVNGTDVLDPNPRTLFSIRNAIDGMMESADGNSRPLLAETRRMVDAELAAKVPGVKEVDARYAELARQREALERGQTVFDTGRATAVRPAELATELEAGALPQGLQVGPSGAPIRYREGARAEIDRVVGTNINDLNALERTFATPADWNYQKLGQVFGDQPRDAMATELATNRQFRDSYQRIVQGSQTAQRSASAKSMEGSDRLPTDATLTGLGMSAVTKVARAIINASHNGTKDEIAQILSQSSPRMRVIAELLLESAKQTREGANAVRGAVANPAYLGAAAPAYGRR